MIPFLAVGQRPDHVQSGSRFRLVSKNNPATTRIFSLLRDEYPQGQHFVKALFAHVKSKKALETEERCKSMWAKIVPKEAEEYMKGTIYSVQYMD